MIRNQFLRATSLLFALSTVAVACGSDSAAEGPSSDAAGSDGDIVISGSSTVEPISIAVAEAYGAEQPEVNISVTGPGTGDGFKSFCAGETDISDASRPIKDEEAAACEEAGISYVELKVGIDGLAVITSADNSAVECLSFADIYALVGPESASFASWSDANELAAEVGGRGGLPDAELLISAPGPESGTYDSFVELVLTDIAEVRGQEPGARVDYSSAADDNVIIETIGGTESSFGWVGFAFADQADGVKMIPVSEEPGGECVAPTIETIASNQYPISRDLFIYVNQAKAEANPDLTSFVEYYLSFGLDEAVAAVDYIPLDDEAKAETIAAWDGR
jgi:phosphate transport system substrate-binding protein